MKNLRILMVDDDVDFIESQAEFLQLYGFETTLAHNGEEALSVAQQMDPTLVLMDMKMPGMNGIQCMMELRRMNPDVRVVMISAFTHDEFFREAFLNGAVAVLNKPLVPEVLLKTLFFLTDYASILMVEDDPDQSDEIMQILKSEGYVVKNVTSIDAAKQVLESEAFDLLLLDFKLPDGTGRDLLEWMAERKRTTNTVVITGFPKEALTALPYFTAEDVLTKPFQPQELLRIIQQFHVQSGAV